MPVHQDAVHEASHAYAATTRAFTPVSRVGWITGAKRGLWLVGSELSVPSFFALSYTSGSSPPKNQNTARSVPLRPKASEILARHRRFSLLYGAVREVL